MKKLLIIVLISILSLISTGCNDKTNNDGTCTTLNVYNWGEYIGENVLNNFENEYNVKVNYSLFDSNEIMYTQLLGGNNYDILVPSEYMIERLISEDLLMPLDLNKIPNIVNIAQGLKQLPYDPNNEYSIPYFWGNVGIVYNKNTVDKELVEKLGYDILLEEQFKDRVYVYDSERDSFMMAFKSLGYSMNSDDDNHIQQAYDWLINMDNTINPSYVTDELIDGMITQQKDIAISYSGQASVILLENENMAFHLPKSGTNYWTDGFVISKDSKCSDLAHQFINFNLTYESALDNSTFVGYPSNHQQVLEELSSINGLYYDNEAYLPQTHKDNPKHEYFTHNELLINKLSDLWIRVKSN